MNAKTAIVLVVVLMAVVMVPETRAFTPGIGNVGDGLKREYTKVRR